MKKLFSIILMVLMLAVITVSFSAEAETEPRSVTAMCSKSRSTAIRQITVCLFRE